MEKISDRIQNIVDNDDVFKILITLVKCVNSEKSRDALKNSLINNKEEKLGKWTELILDYKPEYTLEYVLYNSFSIDEYKDQFVNLYIEISSCFHQLVMNTCHFIYEINTENVKGIAPRSMICFWLFNNIENLENILCISMFLSGILEVKETPNVLLRVSDIFYRFNNIVVPIMKEYHIKLEDELKKRNPELHNLTKRKK